MDHPHKRMATVKKQQNPTDAVTTLGDASFPHAQF
jgi:hypothetical protein